MCEPVTLTAMAIGAGIGATTAAITGQDPLMGALMGAAAGAFAPAGFGVTATATIGPNIGIATGFGASVALGSVATAAGVSLAGSYLMKAMTPETPDYSQFGYGAQPYEYSSQHATVTGSGGRQAAAVLASEIKQAKSLRKRQAEVADYGLGMDMAGTGLQIA